MIFFSEESLKVYDSVQRHSFKKKKGAKHENFKKRTVCDLYMYTISPDS